MAKSPLPPSCAERYAHQKELASGGFGTVHLAVQRGLQRQVVVKLLHSEVLSDPDAVARFQNEARIAAAIDHPNVVKLIEAGFDGVPWIVYEYLPGESVRTMLFDGALPPALAVEIIMQLLAGLAAAHASGILHRDVKPENVLAGEGGHYKVTDFGIAKWTRDGAVQTRTGVVMGTPAYLPPEIIRGDPVDARADVYATGVMLHELLTGEPPFQDENPITLLERHLTATVPPLPEQVTSVQPALGRIVSRALEKRPDRRYASALEMHGALSRLTWEAAPATGEVRRPAPSAWTSGIATKKFDASGSRARPLAEASTRPVIRPPDLASGGLTNSGRFRRQAALATSCVALLACVGIASGIGGKSVIQIRGSSSSALAPPPAEDDARIRDRVATLVADHEAYRTTLARLLAEAPKQDIELKRMFRERVNRLRYTDPHLATLISLIEQASALARPALKHPDLNVRLAFALVAGRLEHLRIRSREVEPARPLPAIDFEWPADGPSRWIEKLLDVHRAEGEARKNQDKVAELARLARLAMPPDILASLTEDAALRAIECVLSHDVEHNFKDYGIYVDWNKATVPDLAFIKRNREVLTRLLVRRDAIAPTRPPEMTDDAIAHAIQAYFNPDRDVDAVARQIRAFRVLQAGALEREGADLQIELSTAQIGKDLMILAPKSGPHKIALPAFHTRHESWAGHYLESFRERTSAAGTAGLARLLQAGASFTRNLPAIRPAGDTSGSIRARTGWFLLDDLLKIHGTALPPHEHGSCIDMARKLTVICLADGKELGDKALGGVRGALLKLAPR